jgi:SAM-dependent methyltransferase
MKLEYVDCDLCGSSLYAGLFEARDYRFGRSDEYSMVRCNDCGLVYINPRPTPESIARLYEEDYTPEVGTAQLPRVESRSSIRLLKSFWHRFNGLYQDEVIRGARGRVLDVGCGIGNLLLPLREMGNDAYGIELNPRSVKICDELGLNVFCGTLEEANFDDGFFDAVILSQVAEHLPSPKNSLKEFRRILKPEGRLYIFCPNEDSYLSKLFGRYWHGWHIPFHFYTFDNLTIRSLAREAGFAVKRLKTVTPTHFFIVSLKSYLFGEIDNGARPLSRGKLLDTMIFRAFVSPVFRVLDSLLYGRGDCIKLVLRKQNKGGEPCDSKIS